MDERILEKAKELNFEITDELDQIVEFAYFLGRESFVERMKIGKLKSLQKQGRPQGCKSDRIITLAVEKGYVIMSKYYRGLNKENKNKINQILEKVKIGEDLSDIKKSVRELYDLQVLDSLKNVQEI